MNRLEAWPTESKLVLILNRIDIINTLRVIVALQGRSVLTGMVDLRKYLEKVNVE